MRAAAELFAERGYVRTTIEEIAARADVAVQTIYNAIGPKRAVLSQVLDASASGPDAPAPVREFLGARIRAETDPVRIVQILADWLTEANARTAAVFGVIREAAAVDPQVASLQAGRGALRQGLGPKEAGAFIWALGNPDVYRFLMTDLGWTPKRYRTWMERSLRFGLLRQGSRTVPS